MDSSDDRTYQELEAMGDTYYGDDNDVKEVSFADPTGKSPFRISDGKFSDVDDLLEGCNEVRHIPLLSYPEKIEKHHQLDETVTPAISFRKRLNTKLLSDKSESESDSDGMNQRHQYNSESQLRNHRDKKFVRILSPSPSSVSSYQPSESSAGSSSEEDNGHCVGSTTEKARVENSSGNDDGFKSKFCQINMHFLASEYGKEVLVRRNKQVEADRIAVTEREKRKLTKASSQKVKQIKKFLDEMSKGFVCPIGDYSHAYLCGNILASRNHILAALNKVVFDRSKTAGTIASVISMVAGFANSMAARFRFDTEKESLFVGLQKDIASYTPDLQRRRAIRTFAQQESSAKNLVDGKDIVNFQNSPEMLMVLKYLRDVATFEQNPFLMPSYNDPDLLYPPPARGVLKCRDFLVSYLVACCMQRPMAIAKLSLRQVRDAKPEVDLITGKTYFVIMVDLHKTLSSRGPCFFPLMLEVYQSLQSYIANIRSNMPRHDPINHDGKDCPVFYSQQGYEIDADYISKIFSRIWQASSVTFRPLKNVTQLRKSATSACYEVDPGLHTALSEQLSHDPSVSKKFYRNVFQRKRAAVSTIVRATQALKNHSYTSYAPLDSAHASSTDDGGFGSGIRPYFNDKPVTVYQQAPLMYPAPSSVPDRHQEEGTYVNSTTTPSTAVPTPPPFPQQTQTTTASAAAAPPPTPQLPLEKHSDLQQKLGDRSGISRRGSSERRNLFSYRDEIQFLSHPEIEAMVLRGKPNRALMDDLLLNDAFIKSLAAKAGLTLLQACDKVYSEIRRRKRESEKPE